MKVKATIEFEIDSTPIEPKDVLDQWQNRFYNFVDQYDDYISNLEVQVVEE